MTPGTQEGQGPAARATSLGVRLRERAWWTLAVLAVVVADQVTKVLVLRSFAVGEDRTVIDGFFSLTLVYNTGGVWGSFSDLQGVARVVLFLALPTAITAVAVAYATALPVTDRIRLASVAAVIGGAIGNLIDRLRLGKVVDFFHFEFRGFHWPAFNVADSAICVGVVVMLVLGFLERRPDEAVAADA